MLGGPAVHDESRQVKAHAKVVDWFRTLQLQAEEDAKRA